MPLPIIEINLNEQGHGTVTVDGHPISNGSYRVEIEAGVGDIPEVTVDMHGLLKFRAPATLLLSMSDTEWYEQLVKDVAERVMSQTATRIQEQIVKRLNEATMVRR